MSAKPMIIIGENIHATRVLKTPAKGGKKAVELPGGQIGIPFQGPDGTERMLSIPSFVNETQAFQAGNIKHMAIAMMKVVEGTSSDEVEEGMAYLQSSGQKQIEAGADFLDINVDELSPEPEQRITAIRTLVPVMQEALATPLSIDSSHSGVIEAALEVYNRNRSGRAMINSASLERPEVLDIAARFDTDIVVSAFGEATMPEDAEQRIVNLEMMVKLVDSKGIARERIHFDPLVFTIGSNGQAVNHFLETCRRLRDLYGPAVHVTGGFSNVSFGLPQRKLLNQVFVKLAIEAGADSGIIDPLTLDPTECLAMDTSTEAYRLAENALLGKDDFCTEFVMAHREGRL